MRTDGAENSACVRWGIVGLGAIGARHARAIAASDSPRMSLAAVACADAGNVDRLGGELGVACYYSAQDLFDSGTCDAVILATPHFLHPPLAIRAARAGLHVLSEKPMGVTIGPVRAAVEECRRNGVTLGVMFQQRLRNSVRTLKQLVDGGALGDLLRIDMVCSTWTRTQAYYAGSPWRGTWAGEGGGVLMNQAPHSLDLFLWLGGMPRSVMASLSTRIHEIEVENTAEIICHYEDDLTGHIYVTTAQAPGTGRLTLAGDRATAELCGGELRVARLPASLRRHLLTSPLAGSEEGRLDAKWERLPCEPDRNDLTMTADVIAAFTHHVLEGTPLVASADDALRQVELTNAAYLSDHRRAVVNLPVDIADAEALLDERTAQSENPVGGLRQQAARDMAQLMSSPCSCSV